MPSMAQKEAKSVTDKHIGKGRQEGLCMTWSWGKGAQWAGWQRREYLWVYPGARP